MKAGALCRSVWVLFLPAAVVVPALAWELLRRDMRGEEMLWRHAVIGWLMFVLAWGSLAVIVTTAAVRAGGRRMWVAYGLLAGGLSLLVVLGAGVGGGLALWDTVKAALVLAGWLAGLTGLALVLGRWGTGTAVVGSALFAAALLAGPVVFMPVVRALGSDASAAAVGYACPTLSLLAAISPSVGFLWPQQTVMYGLTALGQDFPLPLPAWWALPLVSGVLAVVVGAAFGRGED